jgi:hypothetical protein
MSFGQDFQLGYHRPGSAGYLAQGHELEVARGRRLREAEGYSVVC